MSEEVAQTSRAWVLNFGEGLQAAVGHHEVWQVLISPKLFYVPCTPPYCHEVLIFQDRILPVLSVPLLLGGIKTTPAVSKAIGIVIYQESSSQPIHYSGLHLALMPQSVYVNDDQACDLPPDQQQYWESVAISCFSHEDAAIPIIDLASLFAKHDIGIEL